MNIEQILSPGITIALLFYVAFGCIVLSFNLSIVDRFQDLTIGQIILFILFFPSFIIFLMVFIVMGSVFIISECVFKNRVLSYKPFKRRK